MNKPKFSKGPWIVNTCLTGHAIDAEEKLLPLGRICMTRSTSDVDCANAKLIAAGPDMYEALKLVISYLGDSNTWQEGEKILYHHVSNALAKAQGLEGEG